jgi:hypothetical protein
LQVCSFDLVILQRFEAVEPEEVSKLRRSADLRLHLSGIEKPLGAGYQSYIDIGGNLQRTLTSMDIELNSEQRDRLELISVAAGKSSPEMLLETALFLLDRDAESSRKPGEGAEQKFLSKEELRTRFDQLLRH